MTVANQHDPETHRAEQEPEAAEQLESSQVGVLHDQKSGDLLGGRRGVEAVRPQVGFQNASDFGHAFLRCLDEERLVAGSVREVAQEVVLRDQQLALEDALTQRTDDAEPDDFSEIVFDRHVVAEAKMQDPLD